MKHVITVFSFLFITLPAFATEKNPQAPSLLLANVYKSGIQLTDYWISEKLDGVRAYWNGKYLLSRQGKIYHAPRFFTVALPDTELDGELWIGRGKFDELSGIVRRQTVLPAAWSNVKYMVFDLPASNDSFNQRLLQLEKIIGEINQPHVQLLRQIRVPSQDALMQRLDQITSSGGEGLMLHRGASLYHGKRSDDLLKLKKHLDAEATVIAHIPGKGKYSGMLGSLEVETDEHIRFKIGSGFSDTDRMNPPPVGSVITFKYYGLRSTGIPRFASFIRIKNYY